MMHWVSLMKQILFAGCGRQDALWHEWDGQRWRWMWNGRYVRRHKTLLHVSTPWNFALSWWCLNLVAHTIVLRSVFLLLSQTNFACARLWHWYSSTSNRWFFLVSLHLSILDMCKAITTIELDLNLKSLWSLAAHWESTCKVFEPYQYL